MATIAVLPRYVKDTSKVPYVKRQNHLIHALLFSPSPLPLCIPSFSLHSLSSTFPSSNTHTNTHTCTRTHTHVHTLSLSFSTSSLYMYLTCQSHSCEGQERCGHVATRTRSYHLKPVHGPRHEIWNLLIQGTGLPQRGKGRGVISKPINDLIVPVTESTFS